MNRSTAVGSNPTFGARSTLSRHPESDPVDHLVWSRRHRGAPTSLAGVVDRGPIRIGALTLELVRLPPGAVRRTRDGVAHDRGRMVHLAEIRAGTLAVEQDGRSVDVVAGRAILLRSSAEFVVKTPGATALTHLVLPEHALGPLSRALPELTARTLEPTPLTAVTMRTLAQLAVEPPDPDTSAAALIEHAVTDLLRAVVGELAGTPTPAETVASQTRLRTREYIARHLAVRELGPAVIAANINVSTRCLHRSFEDDDTTVAAYIRSSRLTEAARLLTDPDARHLGVAQIAAIYGFGGSSQFTRSFRSRFGLSPTEMRRGADLDPVDSVVS